VKERGILFSKPMILALLAGRKTQTRRLVKDQSILVDGGGQPFTQRWDKGEEVNWRTDVRCPYGVPGDRLWVRETFIAGMFNGGERKWVRYRATDEKEVPSGTKWKPSIYLPRWASRITLEVTEVRAQRLQEISVEDAIGEGYPQDPLLGIPNDIEAPRRWYRDLWDQINGDRLADAWASNPWVWAVSFRVVA
jgi:hypothetical protein